jgi:hypothetical protein
LAGHSPGLVAGWRRRALQATAPSQWPGPVPSRHPSCASHTPDLLGAQHMRDGVASRAGQAVIAAGGGFRGGNFFSQSLLPWRSGNSGLCFFLRGRPVQRLVRPGMGTRSCLITEHLSPEIPRIPLGSRPPDSIRRPLHGPGRPQVGLPSSHQPRAPAPSETLPNGRSRDESTPCCLCIQLGANVLASAFGFIQERSASCPNRKLPA